MRNIYKVNKRKWRKWSIVARGVFNRTYSVMRDNPNLFRHPKDLPQSKAWAKTTAWNAAWLAADHTDETLEAIATS